jgi:hypothetical protein
VTTPWRDPKWQAALDDVVHRAARRLAKPGGREARAWLEDRGLRGPTVRGFALGFLETEQRSSPLDVLDGRRIWAPRGITIPLVAPEAWYSDGSEPEGPRWSGLIVRRLAGKPQTPWTGGDKCIAVAGSRRGFGYPWTDLTPGVPALIVEGELDALLAFQEIGHRANVTTTGGATIAPRPELRKALDASPYWLIATDDDDAGRAAFATWRNIDDSRCRRLLISPGKDVGEMVKKGVDLATWFESEVRRLGIAREVLGLGASGLAVDHPDRSRMLAAMEAIRDEPGDVTGEVHPRHRT